SRVIVQSTIKKEFERRLLLRVKKLKLGEGMKSDVGPLINEAAIDKSKKYVDIGLREGAQLLCGGNPLKIKGKGYYFQPTVFTNVKKEMKIAQDEIFGPVLSIISIKDLDEAIEVANSIDYGLSSAIY